MTNKTILLGIGNIGRQDDGLAWLFLDYIKEKKLKNYDFEYKYQLQIEDAELICNYNNVIFIDATKEKTKSGFYYKNCKPSNKYSFSTHELAPETILFLAKKLYNHKPKASIIGIQGYQWNLKIGLSTRAKRNLENVINTFQKNISTPTIF